MNLVPFLFGLAGTESMPGVALVRLLGEVGVGEAAARSLLARMRRNGYLATERRGKGAVYSLSGSFLAAFRRARDGGFKRPQPWDGWFHAVFYTVPEDRRAFRDKLRRAASLAGYGQMQPGVLIAIGDNRDRLDEELGGTPPAATVRYGRIALETADAAEIARRAWELDELAARYREHTARLASALAEGAPETVTIREYVDLFGTALTDTLRTPALPPELLPPDWPLPALFQTVGQVFARLGPQVGADARQIMAEAERG
ncbi:PaaX family transcriptional regulator C-terminal domain-containing protein [Actinomadura rupiterrae]|uniref:PaaX family transcriptional regulator C-terminal domain-containing protein n=1 Tax=Actinomadura rupiterrae TaxID=559627 RepID=UPI0020A3FF06|nr:PaaX family transcriptional regulator C-terminal domain-containing protein [Actinomadura rupiterrae]MCP2335864.1 phenylacetic acid degradation operon negative regulatory protein [Actinomadura rupiterrae]